ncbi:hypothetical protein [Celeribacter litoreus]|uniref:hypothetical protein n=1 Tax=Celeribacter litoreus TaxID=2876714 RepID=UPI001CCC776F|nr:hypothetical protein [Celeribacter litoreus]MCA0044653.1 hypothetical protein [Celeribacter litoreus]
MEIRNLKDLNERANQIRNRFESDEYYEDTLAQRVRRDLRAFERFPIARKLLAPIEEGDEDPDLSQEDRLEICKAYWCLQVGDVFELGIASNSEARLAMARTFVGFKWGLELRSEPIFEVREEKPTSEDRDMEDEMQWFPDDPGLINPESTQREASGREGMQLRYAFSFPDSDQKEDQGSTELSAEDLAKIFDDNDWGSSS